MEASLLQPLVVHRVSPALPMQQLHQLAAAAHKHIHITVRRIQSNAAHLAAKLVNPGAHITRLQRHHKTVVLIQIKHSKTIFPAKFAKVLLPQKPAYFGCLRIFRMLTNKMLGFCGFCVGFRGDSGEGKKEEPGNLRLSGS